MSSDSEKTHKEIERTAISEGLGLLHERMKGEVAFSDGVELGFVPETDTFVPDTSTGFSLTSVIIR